ncbi:uncharacterized protein A1O9_08764 [Exophiala aquamarina CBS 119918]|uniref:Cyclohexanone monooxygenase n=1 Tax=Exophiala aquamarina CBS 119918 TaxID=1182545 RepID=A0A072P5H8_9EURO|nr:uncharacterized protein A1O9_08764 [Exophiala aquamarina CBS 119918]KEF55111.1 hypothetical protein A1O9_08764 [Exophiala aquamarina CBS 119918]
MNDELAFTARRLRVITVGAGFSGLLMAHKFQHRFPEMDKIVDHTIFEKRGDFGGTWLVNTYPGVQCDVPSHIYAFPFDPNPEWSRFYSSGAEIHQYIVDTVKKWNLDRDVQLNTEVTKAAWEESKGQWKVTVKHNGQSRDEWADVLISGQGVLDIYKWPEIAGIEGFKGHRVHSAHWDQSYDYSHKRIAVIGNGSSGVQIVPQMAKLPGTAVTNFARGPSWIYYRVPPSQHLGKSGKSGNNPEYSEEDKKKFREHPDAMKEHRKAMIGRTNRAFRMFVKDSEANKEAMIAAQKQMAERLGHDPRLCKTLIPEWSLGCRRITPGEGYLESFLLPNCDITQSPIERITENAIHTADGKIHEVDVCKSNSEASLCRDVLADCSILVVCATGFDVSFRPQYPTIGRDGVDLKQKWTEEPEGYFSVAADRMPNYFTVLGPNAVAGHGSLLEAMNWNGDYFIRWIKKMAEEDIKSFCPKTAVIDQFVKYADEIHKSLVWTAPCKSWYKRNQVNGRVTALFGGSGMLYKRIISGELRTEDFEIDYRSPNMFKFMGNGFTEMELNPENDLAWYIER